MLCFRSCGHHLNIVLLDIPFLPLTCFDLLYVAQIYPCSVCPCLLYPQKNLRCFRHGSFATDSAAPAAERLLKSSRRILHRKRNKRAPILVLPPCRNRLAIRRNRNGERGFMSWSKYGRR